jgi:DNA polymerase III subunit beta
MKFTAAAAEIAGRLQIATHVASGRVGFGAGGGVMVNADDSGVELAATDLETSVRLPASAQVERPGRALVPARLLLDVIRMAPGSDVECELDVADQSLAVRSQSNTVRLRVLREDDFPALPSPPEDGGTILPGEEFADAVGQVGRAASRDETRPLLTGVSLTAEEGRLRVVATDSYRLAVKDIGLENQSESFQVTVPSRALTETARLVQQEDAAEVRAATTQNQIIFSINRIMLASRLIDGHFPDYRQLLPESVEHELHFVTEELLDVVRRISLVAQKNTPLRLALKEGELIVSARTPDVGEGSEAMPSEFRGEPLEIGFNPAFLRDGLESVGSPRMVLKLVSALRPGVIEADGENDGGFLYLVMPVRLGV